MNILPNSATPKPNRTCPLCGEPNECAPANYENFLLPCWCAVQKFTPAVLAKIPQDPCNNACVCQGCASDQT